VADTVPERATRNLSQAEGATDETLADPGTSPGTRKGT
jgi:hypothetical protein